ncbi:MAG: hypothetical protein GTO71_07845 [Woeseiaceae bacterium]|nr:hypothetical protein [Woeseiaceae bacterium]NIP21000.1 hypothetical protein [Woeseiaceae bacterium]NIS89980.1 hypothetical protein [Woeseiaceae bacterium]
MSLFSELKRRNVFRVGIAYLALAWLLIEVAGTVFPGFGIPEWAFRFVVILVALGFVPTLIFSWAYEITPEGLRREKEVVREESITHLTARRLDKLTIGLIVVALAVIAVDRFWLNSRLMDAPATSAEKVTESAAGSESEPDTSPRSIAVLPFANRSAKPEDVYFVDGIHDDLLTYISQIGSIKTISRTSVMKYRDTTQSIREIARELGVATVLEGGVQRAGDQVRINVQLIDARTDDHLWSSIYDRQMTAANIFTIQSEIAGSIAAALRATLTPEAQQRIDSIPTENLEALEAYFLGRQSMVTRRLSDLANAAMRFEEAVSRDPNFALAFVGLADTYLLQAGYGGLRWEEGIAKSKAAAEQALKLDPGLGEAYAATAKRTSWEGDTEGAEIAFKQAIQLNPNYAPAYQWYGEMLADCCDRFSEALELSRKATELDPKSAIIVNDYAEVVESSGRFGEALAHYRQAVEIEPRFAHGYVRIADLLSARLGRVDEAILALHKSNSIEQDQWRVTQRLGLAYLDLGDLQQAEYWRDRTLAAAEYGVVPDLEVALHLYLGDKETALEYARKDLESSRNSLHSIRVIRDHELEAGTPAAARARFETGFPELFDDNGLNIRGENREAAVDLAYLLMQTGERELAERLLEGSLAAEGSGLGDSAQGLGILETRILALRGNKAAAIGALRQAFDDGWRSSSWYFLEHDPVLKPLHNEPEFQEVKAEIEVDMARQLARVREWEANGELSLQP